MRFESAKMLTVGRELIENSAAKTGEYSSGISQFSKPRVLPSYGSQKTVRFSKEIMSADKYSNIFLRQMEAIVYGGALVVT